MSSNPTISKKKLNSSVKRIEFRGIVMTPQKFLGAIPLLTLNLAHLWTVGVHKVHENTRAISDFGLI